MLDTVGTKHIYRLLQSDDFLDGWRFLSKKPKPTWTLNAKGSNTLPNLTMLTTPDGFYHLYAQVSLPKFLLGHNSQLLSQTEVFEGLKMVAQYAEEKTGLPYDPLGAKVSLVHFARDINLTEPGVWNAIEKLSKKKLKPLRKTFYEDSTLYFKSKAKTKLIRIYPKLQAVLSEKNASVESIKNARGNLRIECCFLQKDPIDALVRKYALPNSQAQHLLTETVSELVISELLERLDFAGMLTDEKTTLQKLLKHFTTKRTMSLCGFLQILEEHGENFYKDKIHQYSKSTYNRNLTDCRKARVW